MPAGLHLANAIVSAIRIKKTPKLGEGRHQSKVL